MDILKAGDRLGRFGQGGVGERRELGDGLGGRFQSLGGPGRRGRQSLALRGQGFLELLRVLREGSLGFFGLLRDAARARGRDLRCFLQGNFQGAQRRLRILDALHQALLGLGRELLQRFVGGAAVGPLQLLAKAHEAAALPVMELLEFQHRRLLRGTRPQNHGLCLRHLPGATHQAVLLLCEPLGDLGPWERQQLLKPPCPSLLQISAHLLGPRLGRAVLLLA